MTEHSQKNSFEHDLSIEEVLASQHKADTNAQKSIPHQQKLSKRAELLALVGFFVVGGGILLLGLVQFNSGRTLSWNSVFGLQEGEPLPEQEQFLSGNAFQEALSDRTLDTDGDSLPDYDEINVYGTSAYLADSDSDGINDDVELRNGSNPVCPEGQDCGGGIVNPSLENANANSVSPTVGDILPGNNPVNAGNPLDTGLLQGTLNAGDLRSILEANGAPADALGQVDDDTLLQLYNQVLSENPGLTKVTAPGSVPTPEATELEQLQNLSPQEIRDLMIQNGGDAQVINQMSDEELTRLYNETLQNLLSNQNQGN